MEINIGCAPDWVKSSNTIDSLVALCMIWWKIGNNPSLIMDLPIHYNICTKTKCISFLLISCLKVWEALLVIWIDFVCPIQQCLFSPMAKILGTLDHLDVRK